MEFDVFLSGWVAVKYDGFIEDFMENLGVDRKRADGLRLVKINSDFFGEKYWEFTNFRASYGVVGIFPSVSQKRDWLAKNGLGTLEKADNLAKMAEKASSQADFDLNGKKILLFLDRRYHKQAENGGFEYVPIQFLPINGVILDPWEWTIAEYDFWKFENVRLISEFKGYLNDQETVDSLSFDEKLKYEKWSLEKDFNMERGAFFIPNLNAPSLGAVLFDGKIRNLSEILEEDLAFEVSKVGLDGGENEDLKKVKNDGEEGFDNQEKSLKLAKMAEIVSLSQRLTPNKEAKSLANWPDSSKMAEILGKVFFDPFQTPLFFRDFLNLSNRAEDIVRISEAILADFSGYVEFSKLDAAAWMRWWQVLEQNWPGWTEVEASEKLTEIKHEIFGEFYFAADKTRPFKPKFKHDFNGNFKLAFENIVCNNAASAQIHAHASESKLRPGILLVDSGSNFGGFISDVTRVFALFWPTLEGFAMEKKEENSDFEKDFCLKKTEICLKKTEKNYENFEEKITKEIEEKNYENFGQNQEKSGEKNYQKIEISQKIKENYTKVLKAYMLLATAKMAENDVVGKLDILARKSLGDFGHATGHGVGSKHVHAHPTVRADNDENFKENTLFALEPGIYFDSGPEIFGIRLESQFLVRKIPESTLSSVKELKSAKMAEFIVPSANDTTNDPNMTKNVAKMAGSTELPESDPNAAKMADKYELEQINFIPFDYNLILPELLTFEEKIWLSNFHKICYKELVGLVDLEFLTKKTRDFIKMGSLGDLGC